MTHLPNGLTVGLIVSSGSIWQWQWQLIQSLVDWKKITVQEIISVGQSELVPNPRLSLLHKLDGRIFNCPVSAFGLVDVSVFSIRVIPYVESDHDSTSSCDVLINLSESTISESFIKRFSCPILTPLFSTSGELRSQSLGLQQYLQGEAQVYLAVHLQTLNNVNQIIGAMRPSFDTGPLSRNLEQYWYWLLALWSRCLSHFSDTNEYSRTLLAETSVDSLHRLGSSSNPLLPFSALTQGLLRLGNSVKNKLKQKYLQQEQWVLLLKPLVAGEQAGNFDFENYYEITPPQDCFWADPFVITKDGRDYVFFEELPFTTECGHLCCMEVFSDGTHTEAVKIIQEPYHLSYPNVFKCEGEYYLIPESGDKGRVDLYRCTEFPYQWHYEKTLIDNIHAYDSTLIEHQGRWWLFATVAPKVGLSGCEELYIFHSDSPISSNWQAHAKNPVMSDASKARPGGNFYRSGEQLFRVSQDCAGQYGTGLNINEVVELTTGEYQECVIDSHYPNWDKNLIALHTFNQNKNFAVADALRVKAKRLTQ